MRVKIIRYLPAHPSSLELIPSSLLTHSHHLTLQAQAQKTADSISLVKFKKVDPRLQRVQVQIIRTPHIPPPTAWEW
jgi:hypothetical protein